MAITIHDPWDQGIGIYADTLHESERPEHSKLLGPDGQPLRYETIRLGFDLRPASVRKGGA